MIMFNKLVNQYAKFILKIENVPSWWFKLRFVLHWITIPLKLLLIGSVGLFQIARQLIFNSNRVIPEQTNENKKKYIRNVFKKLPVARNINDELYCPRVPYYEKPNGYNHNIDHQSAWHGVYTFLMSLIGKRNGFQELAMSKHMKEHNLYRGYTFNGRVNANTVSGDMLIGSALSLLHVKSNAMEGVITQGGTGDVLKDKFDEIVVHLIENDYALLEGGIPEDGPERELYDDELKRVKVPELVKIKSARGMWQPGLETVGAQALTVLAAVRVADKKCGSITPKRAYKTLLYRYGYGILSLFPTTFIQSKRGYFNDNNSMAALYILAKLADTKLGRLFWTLPMIYVFLLSYRVRNGYFTGMLLDVAPYLNKVLTYHKQQCINYLYENDPVTYSRDNGIELPSNGKFLPISFNESNQGEFLWDHEAKLFTNQVGEEVIRTDNCHSGLGWFAASVLLEPELVKEALNE